MKSAGAGLQVDVAAFRVGGVGVGAVPRGSKVFGTPVERERGERFH